MNTSAVYSVQILINRTNCRSLTELSLHDILRTVLLRTKGGHFDCYGLSYCRGGSNRTQTLRRNGQAIAPYPQNAGVQTWGRMAHRQGRIRRVETSEQESVSETRSGELTSPAGFSVAHQRPIGFQQLSRRRCVCYLVVYYSIGNGVVRRV